MSKSSATIAAKQAIPVRGWLSFDTKGVPKSQIYVSIMGKRGSLPGVAGAIDAHIFDSEVCVHLAPKVNPGTVADAVNKRLAEVMLRQKFRLAYQACRDNISSRKGCVEIDLGCIISVVDDNTVKQRLRGKKKKIMNMLAISQDTSNAQIKDDKIRISLKSRDPYVLSHIEHTCLEILESVLFDTFTGGQGVRDRLKMPDGSLRTPIEESPSLL